MNIPKTLLDGYKQFQNTQLAGQAALYRQLAEGQNPKIMLIGCADSRVDPSAIFSAAPGQLFTVRNVANLTPPYEENVGYHGTSAAIEFAVQFLQVEHIVVMGHGQCGGIAASLAAANSRPTGKFIAPWVDMIAETRDAVLTENPGASPEKLQNALEFAAIRHSLRNLQSFPFIESAIAEKRLQLHGAWFAIASGELRWLGVDNQFKKIS